MGLQKASQTYSPEQMTYVNFLGRCNVYKGFGDKLTISGEFWKKKHVFLSKCSLYQLLSLILKGQMQSTTKTLMNNFHERRKPDIRRIIFYS